MNEALDSLQFEPGYREVKYRHSRQFAPLLAELNCSLLVSTYQAGKLVSVGTTPAGLHLSLHNFQQAMGLALHRKQLAVGSRGVIWFLQNANELAPRLDPARTYQSSYLARRSFITGNIHGHEMAWCGDELWVVNTLFSCLVTLDEEFSFVPRWRPAFISDLAANDRCHLNGLAVEDGRPLYVTAMAESDMPGGWRETKATSGCLIDVPSTEVVARGFAMPHSPRVHGGRVWLLNSGLGTLEVVDPRSGRRDVVTSMPGYTRGLAFAGDYAFVGLSRIRETSVFTGIPLAEHRDELKCAVVIVDLRAGQSVAFLEFETGVEEIFDVQVVVQARCTAITGPYPQEDDAHDIWVVPPPGGMPTRGAVHGSDTTVPLAASLSLSDAEITELVQAGLKAQRQGTLVRSVELLTSATRARPDSPHIHNHLGNVHQDAGRQDFAEQSYRRALSVDPGFTPALQNLGYLLINFGRLDEGLAELERAQSVQPADVNRVMLATALPVIYESTKEVPLHRRRLVSGVDRLVADGVKIDATNTTVPTNFFSAYAGYDDCHVQRQLAKVYRVPHLVEKGSRRNRSGRIRVGFLSSHFHDHTIGRLNLGRITLLDRERFEVTVIRLGHERDVMAERFRAAADRLVEPNVPLAELRKQIAALELDVLVFADVGMNTTTYSLAMSRLAPVQCVTWGHPVTTGYPSMDYFISSRWLETVGADAHYTEQLIRLANLGTYYYRPTLTALKSREALGLDPDRHLYVCCQTLFKMHPDFDPILAEILRRDPLGDLVLIEGRRPVWNQQLLARFNRTMPDVAHRVRMLPPLPNSDFLQLNAHADVLLDTLHFGGGNTSYEGLACGTPIITLPSEFLRGRITQALYQKMQFPECIVDSPGAYSDLAVRLGTDREYRQHVSAEIRERADILYEDPAEVHELERFLTWAANGGSTSWTCG
jgi:uncharacterized protein (TIGR03032 family)